MFRLAVAERGREIATMRALGFGAAAVVFSFLIEAFIISFIGGAVGCIAVLPLNGLTTATMNWQTFSSMAFAFRITSSLLVGGIIFALVMGLLGGLPPALRAAARPVAVALRESVTAFGWRQLRAGTRSHPFSDQAGRFGPTAWNIFLCFCGSPGLVVSVPGNFCYSWFPLPRPMSSSVIERGFPSRFPERVGGFARVRKDGGPSKVRTNRAYPASTCCDAGSRIEIEHVPAIDFVPLQNREPPIPY